MTLPWLHVGAPMQSSSVFPCGTGASASFRSVCGVRTGRNRAQPMHLWSVSCLQERSQRWALQVWKKEILHICRKLWKNNTRPNWKGLCLIWFSYYLVEYYAAQLGKKKESWDLFWSFVFSCKNMQYLFVILYHLLSSWLVWYDIVDLEISCYWMDYNEMLNSWFPEDESSDLSAAPPFGWWWGLLSDRLSWTIPEQAFWSSV